MKKIGILGGTFDPVHNGHMIIARKAMEQFGLDEVRIMTGGKPPHKRNADITSAEVRHEMVKLAAAGEDGLVPFDYELNKKTYSYTFQTLTELNEKYPEVKWYFIIGEDSLRDILKWYKPEIIVKKCILLVYPRSGGSVTELIKERAAQLDGDIREIHAPVFGISSTDIRQRVSEGKSVKYFVPDKVEEYIKEHKLYQ
ncbi:MAG: nicotinate-nucleotide adenylyltransferase [Candidatus Ornithomonoglobus sp.]